MQWPDSVSQWWESLASAAQVLAFLGAAVFFLVKAYQGYLTVDLSLEAACRRSHRARGQDDLAISVTMKRGDRGSVRLRDLIVRVRDEGGDIAVHRLDDIRRLNYTGDGELVLPLTRRHGKMPFLQLTPNESMMVATHVLVPSTSVAVVDVVLQSQKRALRNLGQWRTSAISLPADAVGTAQGASR